MYMGKRAGIIENLTHDQLYYGALCELYHQPIDQ
jgi:hypothetical protein